MALELKITIDELLIRIKTNIPNKSLSTIDFNRSILHLPKDMRQPNGILNNLPYFTSDIKYPFRLIENLDYTDRLEFFFNKQEFTRILKNYATEKTLNEDEIRKNAEKNILATLQLLFPTSFPVVDNLHESYNLIAKNESTIPLFSVLRNPFKNFYYSYLNVDGNVFTFKKTTWLNDILNNPVYQQIFIEYNRIVPSVNKYKEDKKKEDDDLYQEITDLAYTLVKKTNNKKSNNSDTDDDEEAAEDEDNTDDEEEEGNKVYDDFEKALEIAKKEKDNRTIDFTKTLKEKREFLKELQNNTVSFLTINNTEDTKIKIDELTKYSNGDWKIAKDINPDETLRNKINEKIKKILANIEMIQQNYKIEEEIEQCFQIPYKEFVSKNKKLPDEFQNEVRNFLGTTLAQYKRPIRISSNHKLQTFLEQKTSEDTTNFFQFLDNAYLSFINNDDFNDDVKELMNIGVSTLTPGTLGQRKREIHINCEFIGGEVNKSNIQDIYCPFTNDLLANKTKDFIQQNNVKTTFWQVKTSEPIFYIETNESKKDNQSSENTTSNKGSDQNKFSSFSQLFGTQKPSTANSTTSILKKVDEGAKNNFQSKIVFEKENMESIEKKIKEVKRYKADLFIQPDNIFDFLNSKDQSIIRLINEWNKGQYKNVELIVSMQSKIKEYQSNNENNKTLFENKEFINEDEKIKYNLKEKTNELLIKILELLIKDENNKIKISTGGKKNKSAKRVRFSKRKTYKNVQ